MSSVNPPINTRDVPVLSWTRLRWVMTQETLAMLAALYLTILGNGAFFRAVEAAGVLTGARGLMLGTCLFVAITALNFILLCVLMTRWSSRLVLVVLFCVTAVAAHAMNHFGVYLDTDMMRNVLQTDAGESGELLTGPLLFDLLLYGVLPSLVVWRVDLVQRPLRAAALARVASMTGAVVLAIAMVMVPFQQLSSLMRNHHDLRHLVTPGNLVVSLARVVRGGGDASTHARLPVGLGAHRWAGAASRPRTLVIIVGETVRAQNWGLNGYARQTTPQLAKLDVINFPDVTACGTSTAVSLPCMFSPGGRAAYNKATLRRSESLLHVLDRAGIRTTWFDNQGGCKGVCDGLPFEAMHRMDRPVDCDAGECRDTVLLDGLSRVLRTHAGDQLVVLHPLGNHGPAYFKRYLSSGEAFKPACHSQDLGACSRAEIVNAYDNAILGADDLVARAIGMLADADADRDTALLYVSDHGESLGENGLYLHGMPRAIAPRTQTRVPMVLWMSPSLTRTLALDRQCLSAVSQRPASHDNLFHSVLGLMQVSATEYDPARDLLKGCVRTPE